MDDILQKIKQINFPTNQYYSEEYKKTQIYLHHTAGNPSAEGVYQWWSQNGERVGTCIVISGKGNGFIDGQPIQGFSSKYFAYHLGLKQDVFTKFKVPYQSLDKISIAIEICNWGQLTLKNGKFYTYVDTLVPAEDVIELAEPFRGFKYYHAYTPAQIESVRQLLVYWGNRYNIPLDYKSNMFEVNADALKGTPGVWSHTSVRYDKHDLNPQPAMVAMLQSL